MQWPNQVQAALEQVAACLCIQIAADDLPGLCFCGVVSGAQVALDYGGGTEGCQEGCGMAWVRLVTLYPSSAAGVPSEEAGNCGEGLGIEIEVGIVRCAWTPDEDGAGPTEADLLSDTELQVADAMTMRRAIICCAPAKDINMGVYTPYGPQGATVGGFWTFGLWTP